MRRINALIADYRLEDRITLSGSFCMDQCTKGNSGVCVKVDGRIHSVTAATIDDFFRREVVQNWRRLRNDQYHQSEESAV